VHNNTNTTNNKVWIYVTYLQKKNKEKMSIILTALDRHLTIMKIHIDSQCSACEK